MTSLSAIFLPRKRLNFEGMVQRLFTKVDVEKVSIVTPSKKRLNLKEWTIVDVEKVSIVTPSKTFKLEGMVHCRKGINCDASKLSFWFDANFGPHFGFADLITSSKVGAGAIIDAGINE